MVGLIDVKSIQRQSWCFASSQKVYQCGEVFHVVITGESRLPPLEPRGIGSIHFLCHRAGHAFCDPHHPIHLAWIVQGFVNLVHVWSLVAVGRD